MTPDTTAPASSAEARAFLLLKTKRRLDLVNPNPHAWTDDDLAAGLSYTMVWAWRHDGNIRCPSRNIA
jgi:hypothetical protein